LSHLELIRPLNPGKASKNIIDAKRWQLAGRIAPPPCACELIDFRPRLPVLPYWTRSHKRLVGVIVPEAGDATDEIE
jgi:hypothetical protein